MRITIGQGAFLPVPALRGGAIEKAWASLGAEFAARGHQVTHISRLCDGLPRTSVENGVRHVRVRGFDTPSRLWWLKVLDLAYSLRVLAALPQADVLVTHTFFLPILARLKPSAGRPYVHVGRFPRGQMRYYRNAGCLQAPSSVIGEAIRKELGGGGPRVSVVGYPVRGLGADPRVSRDDRLLLYVGRVHPEKGLDLLVDGFLRFHATERGRPWRLRVVGPWQTATGGGGEDYVRKLRAQAGCYPVEFAGPVFDEQALADEYRKASFFCYPSLAERGETFGLAVLEAMSAGLPVIVSSLGCFLDFVRPGHNGFLFDHRAPGAGSVLASCLAEATSRDAFRQDSMRREAIETATAFSPSRIAEAHLADFRTLLPHA